jgi:transcriptional regulator with XRE-family HTH domain
MNSRHRAEADRLADLLGKVIRLQGLSLRSVEAKAGMAENTLARLVRGKKGLYVVHILQVIEALGITPGQFFRVAYPEVGQPLRPAGAGLLGTAGAPPDDEFVAKVSAALVQILNAGGVGRREQTSVESGPEESGLPGATKWSSPK